MEAGRELDALVAEKVMGATWTHQERWPGGPADIMKLPDGSGGVLAERRCTDGRVLLAGGLRPYSTSISDAWEVVEKLAEHGFWLRLTFKTVVHDDDARWEAWFRCVQAGVRGDHVEHEPTAPHAICLAALKAVGVEM